MDSSTKSDLALYLGYRVVADADMIRLFLPGHIATFPFVWCGRAFTVTVSEDDDAERRKET